MARAYLPLYFSYTEPLSQLPDDERGRLVIALLKYAQNGTLPEFAPASATAMLFSVMRSQIDRDTAKYNAKCNKNRDNINSRWNKQSTNEYDGIRSNTNDTKEKEKEKEKETAVACAARLSPPLQEVFRKWICYATEELGREFGVSSIETLTDGIEQQAAAYGETAVCDLIQQTIQSRWKNIYWEKLKEVRKANGETTELERLPRSGVNRY